MFKLLLLLPCLALAVPTDLDGLQFLGVGYNLLQGNPDGELDATSDSGILLHRRILEYSYDEEKLTDDDLYYVPDEVAVSIRDSCSSVTSTSAFYSPASYQQKLNADIGVNGMINIKQINYFNFEYN